MKLIYYSILITMLNACASYSPVQLVGGDKHPAKLHVESCTDFIFGFPTEPEKTTLENVMEKNALKHSDIYSIDTINWPYLNPIYSYRCTQLTLNSSYTPEVSKNPKATGIISVFSARNPNEPNMSVAYVPLIKEVSQLTFEEKTKRIKELETLSSQLNVEFSKCQNLIQFHQSSCKNQFYKDNELALKEINKIKTL